MTWVVYVIGAEQGPYKIGIASDAERRMRLLQTGNPERLQIHHTAEVEVAMAKRVEASAHRLLSAKRLVGEWFAVPLAAAIEAVSAVTSPTAIEVMPPKALRKASRRGPDAPSIVRSTIDIAMGRLDRFRSSRPERPSRCAAWPAFQEWCGIPSDRRFPLSPHLDEP